MTFLPMVAAGRACWAIGCTVKLNGNCHERRAGDPTRTARRSAARLHVLAAGARRGGVVDGVLGDDAGPAWQRDATRRKIVQPPQRDALLRHLDCRAAADSRLPKPRTAGG